MYICVSHAVNMKNEKDARGSNIKKINQILRSRPNPVDSNNSSTQTIHEKNRVHLEQGITHEFKFYCRRPNTIIVIKFCFPHIFGGN